MKAGPSRIPATERLRTLPEVFTTHDVMVLCDVSQRVAHLYCYRWVDRGYAKSFGYRSGVYFNLFRDPNAAERVKEALDLVLGSTEWVVIGSSALSMHGATTQTPKQLEVAVMVTAKDRSYPELEDVKLIPRNRYWFRAVHGHYSRDEDEMPTLDVGYALVDALTTKLRSGFKDDVWRPGADDIELPEDMALEDFRGSVLDAAKALGGDMELIEDYLTRIGVKHTEKHGRRM